MWATKLHTTAAALTSKRVLCNVGAANIANSLSGVGNYGIVRPVSSTGSNPAKSEEKSFVEDRNLTYIYSKESEFALGKHRSNALDLVMRQPVIYVDGDTAICDGGGGALGHPVEYIAVAHKGGKPEACAYCGLRYAQHKHH